MIRCVCVCVCVCVCMVCGWVCVLEVVWNVDHIMCVS